MPIRIERACAKINLTLRVTGRRADGFHWLDSLVGFADAADELLFYPSNVMALEITGPFADGLTAGPDNLVMRAASALCVHMAGVIQPARMVLRKNLPVASGIGGGSTDAAAALRGLCVLSGLDLGLGGYPDGVWTDLATLGLKLGADVPVCLTQRVCRMTGIGETITSLPHLDGMKMYAVLANPGVAVSTADVFARVTPRALKNVPRPDSSQDMIDQVMRGQNDLEAPARAIAPEIGGCLDALRALPGAYCARMSGSGATCFGLFATFTQARAAASALKCAHPDWWIVAGEIGSMGTRDTEVDRIE